MDESYPWFLLYKEAILETDNSKIGQRIDVARAAIDSRLMQFVGDSVGSDAERIAIEDALNGLRILCRERVRNRRSE